MSDRNIQDRRLALPIALAAAWHALPRMWAGAWGALALTTAIWLALSIGVVPTPVIAGAMGAGNVLFLVTFGALARLSIADGVTNARALGLGPLGFQLGKPELRLLGAGLLCLLFLAMVVALLGLVVLAIFGMAELDVVAIRARDWAGAGASWKLAVSIAVGIGAVLVPLMLAGRLSLFVPATVGRARMTSLTAMSLSAGSGIALLSGLALTSVPTIGLGILIGSGLIQGVAASVVSSLVLFSLQLPLTLAFLGAAYRQLDDELAGTPSR